VRRRDVVFQDVADSDIVLYLMVVEGQIAEGKSVELVEKLLVVGR
jgi:hypothetical protein